MRLRVNLNLAFVKWEKMHKRKGLVLFNLETDLDSRVLASNHDLLNEFSKRYKKVFVYSTHVGRTKLPENVHIVELGGGTPIRKAIAVLKILKVGFWLMKENKNVQVYHHMSTRTLLILGPLCKALRIPTLLWYSHSVADRSLKLSHRFADVCLSSTQNSFPVNARNFCAIGHGIALEKFESVSKLVEFDRKNILALGRLVPIKRLEKIIDILGDMSTGPSTELGRLFFIGPSNTSVEYRDMLTRTAILKKVDLEILDAVNYEDIPSLLSEFSIVYSGTPRSVDKAVLEAAISGCFIVSASPTVQYLTGMDKLWPDSETKLDIALQLKFLQSLDSESLVKARLNVMNTARKKNDLSNQVEQIIREFQRICESRA